MDIERIVNAQEALIELFPDLQSAVTVAMAQAALTAIHKARKDGIDPHIGVWNALLYLIPIDYCAGLNVEAAALYVVEADRLWLAALGEAQS